MERDIGSDDWQPMALENAAFTAVLQRQMQSTQAKKNKMSFKAGDQPVKLFFDRRQ